MLKTTVSLPFAVLRLLALVSFWVATLSPAQVPQASHVVIVVEENHSYSNVVGNPSMPFLNSLILRYGLATEYFANTHPSVGNYFMLTTGRIVTNNDSFSATVTSDNIVRHLLTAGKTWKAYLEGLPSVGYTGGDQGLYVIHHNPFAFLSDVINSSSERRNLVPFTQFTTDLNNGSLPNYSFIVPNNCNNAHNCSLGTADSWLRHKIGPLLASSTFRQSGLLIITFDESIGSDRAHGGGRVAAVIVSSRAKAGYRSTTFFQHQSTLRLMMEALGMSPSLGTASSAPRMEEFFK